MTAFLGRERSSSLTTTYLVPPVSKALRYDASELSFKAAWAVAAPVMVVEFVVVPLGRSVETVMGVSQLGTCHARDDRSH